MTDSAEIKEPAGSAPKVWSGVPARLRVFTGREELLERLHSGVGREITAVIPHALHGMGGVGKTQMTVEYAYRYRNEYDLVWWVPAEESGYARATLAALAPHLELPPAGKTGVEEALAAVLDALRRGEPYRRWLLIFDNADSPEEISPLLPDGPGHILITSRNPGWDKLVDTVPVDVFTREESIEFLHKRLPRGLPAQDAYRLAEALGDLPLALEQAAALQLESGLSASQYLAMLEDRVDALMTEGQPGDYPVSMTAAWKLSVDELRTKRPDSIALLRCCAYFGPEPIPRDVFEMPPPGLDDELAQVLSDPLRLGRAVAGLNRYALARVDNGDRTLQVHRLIQALVRSEVHREHHDRLRSDVHRLLAASVPESPADNTGWAQFAKLFPHVKVTRSAESDDPAVRSMVNMFVRYLYIAGDFRSAQDYAEAVEVIWTTRATSDDLGVFAIRRERANVIRELGQYAEAYELNRESLKNLRVMDRSDAEYRQVMLDTLNSFGADLRAQGDFREARQHDEDSLKLHETDFGPDDYRTLRVVNNLASDYLLVSDYEGARKLAERCYKQTWRRGPGINAVDVLIAWNGLAQASRLLSDFSGAIDLGEDVSSFCAEELGPEHPRTIRTLTDLSIAYRRGGDYVAALDVAQETYHRCLRLFGNARPDTMAAATALVNVLRSTGLLEDSTSLAAEVVDLYPRIYGPQHPYRFGTATNLALLQRRSGDPAAARHTNESALAGLEAKLGRDHHYSLTVATNLASDLAALGDVDSAVRLGRGTLRRLTALLGADHATTMSCTVNLSLDLRDDGAEEEADELYEDVLDRYARTLGLTHPDAVVAQEHRRLDCDFDPLPI